MTDKHAIVTGAHGFLGRHVAKVFSENGFSVTGLGHGTWIRSEWEQWGISDWHSCNITMASLNTYIQQPDVIIHCAGSGSVGYSLTHPLQDYERTVSTSITLLEFIRLHYPETSFIYPSSAAIYGIADIFPIAESAPLHPVSPYGVHKKIVEEISQSYARHFAVPVAIVRFFSLYGPYLRKQLLWDACKKITNNDFTFYGTGKEIRDWIHVTDAARLLFTLASHASVDMPIVNGGSGIGTPISNIINNIIIIMNKSGIPLFSHEQKSGDPREYIADIRNALRYNWKPEITLETGLPEYVQWFLTGAL